MHFFQRQTPQMEMLSVTESLLVLITWKRTMGGKAQLHLSVSRHHPLRLSFD